MLSKMILFHTTSILAAAFLISSVSQMVMSLGRSPFQNFECVILGLCMHILGILYCLQHVIKSYRRNLTWCLLLPINRWAMLVSIVTSFLMIFLFWGLGSLSAISIHYLMDLVFQFPLSFEAADFFEKLLPFNIEFVEVINMKTIIHLDAVENISSVIFITFFSGLIGLTTYKQVRPTMNLVVKKKNFWNHLLFYAGIMFTLLSSILIYSYSPLVSFLILALFFIISFITLAKSIFVLPKEKINYYYVFGIIIWILYSVPLLLLARFQLNHTNPHFAIRAIEELGILAPEIPTILKAPNWAFLLFYRTHKSSDIDMEVMSGLLSKLEQGKLKGKARTTFFHPKFSTRFQSFLSIDKEKLINSIDFYKAYSFNPEIMGQQVFLKYVNIHNDPPDQIIQKILEHNMGIDSFEALLSFDLELMNENMLYTLLSPPTSLALTQEDFNSLHFEVIQAWAHPYLLGLYFLRYLDIKSLNERLVIDYEFLKKCLEQIKDKTTHRYISIVLKTLHDNLKLIHLEKMILPQNMSRSEFCKDQFQSIYHGSQENIAVTNICLRNYFYTANGIQKVFLESNPFRSHAQYLDDLEAFKFTMQQHWLERNNSLSLETNPL